MTDESRSQLTRLEHLLAAAITRANTPMALIANYVMAEICCQHGRGFASARRAVSTPREYATRSNGEQ